MNKLEKKTKKRQEYLETLEKEKSLLEKKCS
jgi:hypothetical protein